jgi:hypothetical protein
MPTLEERKDVREIVTCVEASRSSIKLRSCERSPVRLSYVILLTFMSSRPKRRTSRELIYKRCSTMRTWTWSTKP